MIGSYTEESIQRNEYQLPSSFAPSDLIIDVGAHVGFFTSLVLNMVRELSTP